MAKHTVKKVNVTDALLKEYSPEDLVHFVAVNMNKRLRMVDLSEDAGTNLGALMNNMLLYSAILDAADKKMNEIDDSPSVAV